MPDSIQQRLRPCPFCGSQPNEFPQNTGGGADKRVSVWCESCGTLGPNLEGNSVAKERWNARPSLDQAVEALTEARDNLERLLDYALTHDTGLIEHANENQQSPLVTSVKASIAKIDATLVSICASEGSK